MGLAVQSISTAGVPQAERARYWADMLQRMVGNIEVCPIGGEIDGQIDMAKLGRLQIAQVYGCNTCLIMPGASDLNARTPSIHLLFQRQGTSIFEQDGKVIEVAAGDCLAYDFERAHRISSPTPTRLHSLRIPRELLNANGFELRRMTAVKLNRDPMVEIARDLVQSIVQHIDDIEAESQATVADALVRFLMPSLARDVSSISRMTPAQTLMMRARSFIEANLGDPELDVDRMARVLGCTRRYLHMVFAAEGTTIARTIWAMRLDRARGMLNSPEEAGHSITDIAFACGFSSSAHFSRTFKDRFGFTPSNARVAKAT